MEEIVFELTVDDILDYLDDLIEEAENNLATYENFDPNYFNATNIKNLDAKDAFLYGVANGKRDQLETLRDLVEGYIEEL